LAKPAALKLLTVSLSVETDLILARQRAKQIADVLGFETQDQTRIATAVSEIARNAFEYGGSGRVLFSFEHAERDTFLIVVEDSGPGIANLDAILAGTYISSSGMGLGVIGSRRLMDGLDIDSSPKGTRVTMRKSLPRGVNPPSTAEIGARLLALPAHDTKSALQSQNHEMLRLLQELREREGELSQLNLELKETNRGVMVLYSELEDRAQELQNASEMKTRFVSGITHELRTPLNSIVSLAGLLIRRIDGELSSEQEKQVHFIQKSAQNLTEMVNDLLDLAKLEAGKITLRSTEFSIGDVFAALRGMFRPLATNENVQLIFEEQAVLHTRLYTDEGKVAQILRNFISNALKFTEHGSVHVRAALTGERGVRFSVKDTGVGIADANRDIVWAEWGQIESDQRPRHKGSGLGLPLARQLAVLLGGSTGLESKLGEGSTFYVELPTVVAAPEPAVEQTDRSILIVDDDEVARYIVRRHLVTLTSARVLEATSPAAARVLLKEHRPALVFLDIVMPEESGIDFAEELRSSTETSDLPIVLVSSKLLTTEERNTIERLKLTFVKKEIGDADDQRVALERALLNVGFNDLHLSEGAR
jgi:signal transduction histidine kinase/ActR/RegA family two-component response regulator